MSSGLGRCILIRGCLGELLVTRISCSPLARRSRGKKGNFVKFCFPSLTCTPCAPTQCRCAHRFFQARGRAKGMLLHLMSSPLSSGEQNFAIGCRKKSDISAFLSSPVPPALRLIAGVRCASTKPGAEPRALFHLMSSPLSSGEHREKSFALGVGVKKWVGGQKGGRQSQYCQMSSG